MCAFVVLGFDFSIPSQEIGLGNISKMTCLCWVGRKTTTQSGNQMPRGNGVEMVW